MLITKPIQPNDIVVAKLVTNEEILAKITEIATTYMVFAKPVTLQMMPGPNNQAMVGSLPFMIGNNEDASFKISNDHIIACVLASDVYKNNYIRATSGIELSTKSGLVLDNLRS